MRFERIRPGPALAQFVEWFWCVESDDPTPRIQKIVPDGYPEVIFHYGDPYRICLNHRWSKQGRALVGGQMSKYFYLANTGIAGMFGITLKPTALTHLFQIPMRPLTGRVINLAEFPRSFSKLSGSLDNCSTFPDRIAATETFLQPYVSDLPNQHLVDRSLRLLREQNGLVSILTLCESLGITDRHLQRLYGRYVGLTPKYYARIIRFNTIFSQIKEGKITWADVIHASGYYDQSHFIRDFKAFTGEDPTSFPFREPSLTNFFTRKIRKSDLSNTDGKPLA